MNFIEKTLNDFEDDFGPSSTVQESRPMFNDGGMLVQPSDDGSRPGYAKPIDNPLTKNQKQKVIDAFPDVKFDFDTYPKYGVKKYLTGDDLKTNKNYTKVDRFTKKGFTLEQGKGLSTRGQVYQDRGKRLSIKDQNKIKSLFELPAGEEWDFKTHKYGIKQAGRENLLVRMARVVKEKKPWTIAADVGSPKGWMLLQMNRVYKNELKDKVKNPTYKPVYEKINGVNKIIGFKDNTTAGQGKTYYGLDKYSKKNAADWTKHGDYKQNVKLFDIAKRSNNAPNEVITGLLNDKGFKGKVTLNNLVNFLSGIEETSPAAIKNAIVRHHNSGVAFGSATNDLSLTTQIINKKIVEAEQRIRSGNVLPEDVQLLKNNNIFVRGSDGKLYGAGKKSAIGQFKQIESNVASALESGVDFKGNKFTNKQLKKYLNPQLEKQIKIQFCTNRSGGQPGACDISEAMDNMVKQTNAVKQGAIKGTEATRIANKASKVVRFGTGKGLGAVLGPLGLGAEAVFEVGMAVPGYARGESGKRLLGDSILGLIPGVGQSAEEEFDQYATKDGMSQLEQQKIKDANRFLELNDALSTASNVGVLEGRGAGRGGENQAFKLFEKQYKEYEPLYNQFVGGPPSESASTALAEQRRINDLINADKAIRARQRDIAMDEDFMAAGGGIANVAGVDKGPAPQSGPTPQGLQGLFNRAKNY